jgi:2-dehydropantoate 2-reductase
MRFVVLGAGAVGGTVGALLARRGHDVVLIARGAHGTALARSGLRLQTPREELTIRPPVVATPTEIAWRADDIVLLAVKLHDAAVALRVLAASAPPTIGVACLSNGLEGERLAARWFARVQAVCVRMPTSHLDPGVVQAWGAPTLGSLDVGRYPAGVDDLTLRLVAALGDPEVECEPRHDIMAWKRHKLLANLGNAVEALCGPDAPAALHEAARDEGEAVLTAAGLSWTSPEVARIRIGVGEIAGRTRGGGSTWQSLARGTGQVEADYLNGEIVMLGVLAGVPTPVNRTLQGLVATAARTHATPGAMPAAELAARLGVSLAREGRSDL